MELIRISSGKMKIMLSKSELDCYDLTFEGFNAESPKSKGVTYDILLRAKKYGGLDLDGKKVFLQIFRAKDGGCEIFVSEIKAAGAATKKRAESIFYILKDQKTLLALCARLSLMSEHGESAAYIFEDGKRYLLRISSAEQLCIAVCEEYASACEAIAQEYIDEHFKPLCREHAVETLGRLN